VVHTKGADLLIEGSGADFSAPVLLALLEELTVHLDGHEEELFGLVAESLNQEAAGVLEPSQDLPKEEKASADDEGFYTLREFEGGLWLFLLLALNS